MKQSTLSSILLSCLLAFVPLNIEAQFPQILQGYPPVNATPPPLAEFTALVDMTKIPNAPVRIAQKNPCDDDTDPFCYWSCTLCLRENDIKTCPNPKDWGITYDDGPSQFTPAILDHLKAKNAKATFFVVGSRVSEHPDFVKRAVADGHQVGIHTWSHTPLTTLSNEAIIAEVQWTAKAIEEATGIKPELVRPPQGDHDDRVRFIVNSLGYRIAMWNKDPNDWMVSQDLNYDVSWISGNFTQWVNEQLPTGRVSLEHDLFQESAAHAPEALDIVLNAGFNTRTISDCASQPALDGNTTTSNTTTSTSAASSTPSTSIENNQYSSSASSDNLLTVNSFIGLSITAVITIFSYSLNF